MSSLASSLAACLRFAAALIPPSATPSTICTKAALGGIVVDAHRLAQRVSVIFNTGDAPSDPRKLLLALTHQDEQLTGVSFGDVTWDFQGVVAQTLEMELEDVEERAGPTNTCVLLAVSSPLDDAVETAVVWFPHANTSHSSNNSKKYLLYVVPGRVKVVKSLGELMTRLQDEMATVRRPGATYKVWTLMAAVKKAKEAAGVRRSEPEEDEAARPPSPVAPSPVAVKPVPVVDARRVTSLQCPKQRVTVTVAERKPYDASIFSFPQVVAEVPPVVTALASDATPPPVDEPISTAALPLKQPVQVKPPGVSASLASRWPHSGSDDSTALWQSTDGKIKRAPIPTTTPVTSTTPSAATNGDADDIAIAVSVVDDTVKAPSHRDEKPMTRLRVRPMEPPQTPVESMFQFSSTACIVSSVLDRPQTASQLRADTVAATTEKPSSSHLNDVARTTQEEIRPKKRSMRDHYRAKLGARGWWELEYQATKLLEQVSGESLLATREDDRIRPMQKRQTKPATISTVPQPVEQLDAKTQSSPLLASVDHRVQASETVHSAVDQRQLTQPAVRSPFKQGKDSTDHAQHQAERSEDAPSTSTLEQVAPATALARASESMDAASDQRAVQAAHSLSKPAVSPYRTVRSHSKNERLQSHTAAAPATTPGPFTPPYIRRQQPVDDNGDILIHHQQQVTEVGHTRVESEPRYRVRSRAATTTARPQRSAESEPVVRIQPAAEAGCPKAKATESIHPISDSRKVHEAPSRQEPIPYQPPAPRFQSKPNSWTTDSDQDDDCVLTATLPLPRQHPPPRVTKHDTEEVAFATKPATAVPFSRNERVPIRLPKSEAQRAALAATDDDTDEQLQKPLDSKRTPAIAAPASRPLQPAASSFVTIDTGGASSTQDDDTKRARESKLAELRQRKLLALQKVRDESLLKKKPSEEHTTHRTATNHTKATNRQLIQNAIEYTLLAGGSLEKERQAALAALAASPCDTFVVLLKSAKELKFRALYEHHVDRNRILRVFSTTSSAPPVLTDDVVGQFFRYNSGKKEFAAVDSRTFTVKTDACALADHVVFKKKPLTRVL